jgi:D-glycero-alpha-D-manno-heptose-7-phosphate kinase
VTRARAPLRLGLAGGGTDLSAYCQHYGGAILNVTIDRHAYAFLSDSPDGRTHFVALDIGVAESFDPREAMGRDARLVLHQGVYARIVRDFLGGEAPPLVIQSSVDAPAGSGLGSSSALVVALLEAFRHRYELPLGRYEIAHLAWEIERIDLGLAGGRQDQYAAAFGGVNFMEFLADDRVIVNPLRLAPGAVEEIESSLVVCFTGQSRSSHDIIVEQTSAVTSLNPQAIEAMHQLKADCIAMKAAFVHGDVEGIAEILRSSWVAKQRTAKGVSNPLIEGLYDVAMANGALAGKISGAGGGGFMMFITRPERRHLLIAALRAANGTADAAAFTHMGSVTWTATL